jgi:hypothetical protein
MELTHSNEQSYQLELQAYQTIFCDFKYEPPSFVTMEIGTNSRVFATPFVVQHVTKPINPLRGGTCLQIIPLFVQSFIILVPITIVVNQPMEGIGRSDKKQDEPINLSYIILDIRFEFFEFLSTSVPLTPHQIGISQEVTLISNASEIYTTPIVTFEETHDRQKTVVPTSLQILSQIKLVEATSVKPVKEVINQLVIEG